MKTKYSTVIDAIEDLKKKGFTYDFNLDEKKLTKSNKEKFEPVEFMIVEVHRFEGESNPADSSIVYAIESTKYNVKGYLLNAYGAYADPKSTGFISKVEIEHVDGN